MKFRGLLFFFFFLLPLFQHAAPCNPTTLGYRPKMKTFGPPLKMLSHDHPALLFHSEMLLPWKLKLVCRLCGNTGSSSRRWMCVVCSTPRLQGRSDGSLFLLVNSHWEAFHTCALTALADCQQEVSSIWETLRQDSRQMQFQGSLFDLCSPSSSPRISSPLAALTLPLVAALTLTWPNWCSV